MADYKTVKKQRPLEKRTRPEEFFEGAVPGTRPSGVGPTGPLGPSGATPVQPVYDPTRAPTIDETIFPQVGTPGVGPAPLDRMAWAAQTGDWRNVAFAADTLREDDFEDGEGQKRLGQVRKIAQGGEGVVDIRTVGGRMADSLRPFLKQRAPRATALPAAPEMTDPDLSSQITKIDEILDRTEGSVQPGEAGYGAYVRSREGLLEAQGQVRKEQTKRWVAQREQEFQANMTAIELPEEGQQMTPEQRQFQEGKYRRQRSMVPDRPATDYDWQLHEAAARTGRLLAADTALQQEGAEGGESPEAERERAERQEMAIKTAANLQPVTPEAKEAQRVWKMEQQKLAAKQRKDNKAAQTAARKATAEAKKAEALAKKLGKTPEGRKALIKAQEAKADAEKKVEVAKVAKQAGLLTKTNEKYQGDIEMWRKRQIAWVGEIDKIRDKIDAATSVVDKETNLVITESQVRKEHPGWFRRKQLIEQDWLKVEEKTVPGLQGKIDTNNKKLGDLGVKTAEAGAGVAVAAAPPGAAGPDDRFASALKQASETGRTSVDPNTFPPDQRQQIIEAMRKFQGKK